MDLYHFYINLAKNKNINTKIHKFRNALLFLLRILKIIQNNIKQQENEDFKNTSLHQSPYSIYHCKYDYPWDKKSSSRRFIF